VARAARVVEVGVCGKDPRQLLAADPDLVERLEQRLAVHPCAGIYHGRFLGVVHVHGPVLVGPEHPSIMDVQIRDPRTDSNSPACMSLRLPRDAFNDRSEEPYEETDR